MNEYEAKKQARIDHYRDRADKSRAEQMLSSIPPDQPLLVDHYSYKSDKRYRDRAWDKMGKSVEAHEKAAYYEEKAKAAEQNTAISSDDPEAVSKLKEKLERLEHAQAYMKKVNAYYRKNGTCLGCEGLSPDQALKLDHDVEAGHSWEKVPYPSYHLSNNNQEINRLKKRIQALEARQETDFVGWEFEGGHAEVNRGLNRLQIFFEEKPEEELRRELKGAGFRWAPSEKAWQRQLSRGAFYSAGRIPALRPLSGQTPSELQPKPPKRDTPAHSGPTR